MTVVSPVVRTVRPGDPGWDEARAAFNAGVDQRPHHVAEPADAAGVAEVVRAAAAAGLRVVAQRTGHGAAALGDLRDTVLVRNSALRDVRIDVAARRARIGAGARWGDVVAPAASAGLLAPHGSSAGIGVAGYALHGGVGWYVRAHGLAAHAIVAAELVTGDGTRVRVDAGREPELLWALRGGGGPGIVTELELELRPAGPLYGGVAFFPIERAAEVLHAWRDWAALAPEHITSIGRLLRLPDRPHVPAHLRGRAFALVEAVALAPPDAAEWALAPLRALKPEIDTFGPLAPTDVPALHMDPAHPVPFRRGDALLARLPAAALDALLAVAGPDRAPPLPSIELRHVAGAATRSPDAPAALAALAGPFAMTATGMLGGPVGPDEVAAALDELTGALAPFTAPARVPTFAEARPGAAGLFDAATLARLAAVRRRVDPDGVIAASHEVPLP
ncbi:MAG: FAD-binding protein [Solirubrobacteraceae bacterium]|nr:FAD-binding protein [Solirubrobacteraceae bacterium]